MICRKCKETVPDGMYCSACGAKQDIAHRTKRGNGTGSVFRRGKFWYAQITLYSFEKDGKTRQKRKTKGGFAAKKDALEYLSTLKSAEARTSPTLLKLYESFEAHDLPKLSASKQIAYKKARERADAIIGKRIDELTVEQMQTVVDAAGSHYKARDIKNLLSKLYQLAMPEQYVSQNLAKFVSLPELEEKEPVPFTQDEVDKLWEAFADGETFVGYLLLMIYSGMMPGELFACKKSMIDLDRCEIYGCGKKTKTRKTNAIVFADCVSPVVSELMDWQRGDKLVNVHETVWYNRYHETLQRLGIRDLPPYSCRHTTGTEAARQNLNAAIVQKIMRHAKITTSQRYIHLGTEDTHSGINTITHKKMA